MKKQMKKLVLAKETLRALNDLSVVRGGGGSNVSNCLSCLQTSCPREYSGSECTNCSDWC
jgi:hypothetical protein